MNDFWDVNKIKKVLPKDYPFLFIDRVVEIDLVEKRIKGLKNITVNEHFFSNHFPGKPIIPGAILVEAAYQASIILCVALGEDSQFKIDYCLDKVEASFFSKVRAGDQLILEAKAEKLTAKTAAVRVVVSVSDNKCAELTVFLKLNKGG
ncbi:MAG: 3-hydroxyacyl-[acyl-carrier-protein] dehydratase FabZ [Candidatus Omnitrophica bacterium]|nr:3-hydroxyacyl-[acyl-carrier-protein] dehydratase FabZ [Candidatus Omnitrophota bacterium]